MLRLIGALSTSKLVSGKGGLVRKASAKVWEAMKRSGLGSIGILHIERERERENIRRVRSALIAKKSKPSPVTHHLIIRGGVSIVFRCLFDCFLFCFAALVLLFLASHCLFAFPAFLCVCFFSLLFTASL